MDDRIACVLAEQMAFIAGTPRGGVIRSDIGGIVVHVFAAVHKPQPSAISDQRRHMRPVQAVFQHNQLVGGGGVTIL
jgi:hypothetical protein